MWGYTVGLQEEEEESHAGGWLGVDFSVTVGVKGMGREGGDRQWPGSRIWPDMRQDNSPLFLSLQCHFRVSSHFRIKFVAESILFLSNFNFQNSMVDVLPRKKNIA